MSGHSTEEKKRRNDFIHSRLVRGFSFANVVKLFSQEFQCSHQYARRVVNKAIEGQIEKQPSHHRRRMRSVFEEMLHDQIVSYQSELVRLQQFVDDLTSRWQRRKQIQDILPTVQDVATHGLLLRELEAIGADPTQSLTNLIETRTRVRERMVRVINNLINYHGFSATNDWRHAINLLIDNGYLSAEAADELIFILDDTQRRVRDAMKGGTGSGKAAAADDDDE